MSFTQSSGSSYSDALSELLATGKTRFDPSIVRYVCHTSTIPLATTVDEQYLLRDYPSTVSINHSIKYIDDDLADYILYKCCKKHCMYTGKHVSSEEILRGNCPCGEIIRTEFIGGEEVDVSLQPLCFLQVIKELRYNFGYIDASESPCDTDEECCHNEEAERPRSNRPRINFEEVMFCQNSQSILDGGYSAPLRKVVGFSGWEKANTVRRLSDLLSTIYWYRKYSRDSLLRLMSRAGEENFKRLKECVAQTLHTVNGMICKKLLLFPCEMEGYAALAKYTAILFEALLRDYLHYPSDDKATTQNSIFLKIKQTFKNVKEHFASENFELRRRCFELTITGVRCAFEQFWCHAFGRLLKRIEASSSDYTKTIAWINTMSGFSQTRNLGYLPNWIALQRRADFRRTIGRPTEKIPMEELLLIRRLVEMRSHESGVEQNLLLRDSGKTSDRFKEVINSISLPLKVSASENSTVRQGGKVEDARQLISDGIQHSWKVPVRDLDTGDVLEELCYSSNLRVDQPAYEGYLFWTAMQIVLNHYAKIYPSRYASFARDLPGSSSWESRLFRMSIVHISEPGKERNLTKTSSLLAWVLTVCSKVSQTTLSYNQDHRAGLVLSAQDWMHQRRISSESYEAYFIYDERTRKRNPDVWNGFQDWTESTDFIPRQVGGMALQSWLGYIGFPKWYGNLVCVITQSNYDVREVTSTNWVDGIMERDVYQGGVTEGFMMSMPLTKTILHLMHDVNIGLANTILRREFGVHIPSAQEVLGRYIPIPSYQATGLSISPEDTY